MDQPAQDDYTLGHEGDLMDLLLGGIHALQNQGQELLKVDLPCL